MTRPEQVAQLDNDPSLEQLRSAYNVAENELGRLEAILKKLDAEMQARITVPMPATVIAGYMALAGARLRDWAIHLYQVDLEAERKAAPMPQAH